MCDNTNRAKDFMRDYAHYMKRHLKDTPDAV